MCIYGLFTPEHQIAAAEAKRQDVQIANYIFNQSSSLSSSRSLSLLRPILIV